MVSNMESLDLQDIITRKPSYNDAKFKPPTEFENSKMTSSIISSNSSLTSPVDSGVQLLDSESEITSVMSVSGIGDIDTIPNLENDDKVPKNDEKESQKFDEIKFDHTPDVSDNMKNEEIENILSASGKGGPDAISNQEKDDKTPKSDAKGYKKFAEIKLDHIPDGSDNVKNEEIEDNSSVSGKGGIDILTNLENDDKAPISDARGYQKVAEVKLDHIPDGSDNIKFVFPKNLMTKSDIANHNVTNPPSSSRLANEVEVNCDIDLSNISLNSYELLDYTIQNIKIEPEMHVSMSEEVNEGFDTKPVIPEPEKPDEQIVFRRQRKKKSKSDTPKKRVSFHEDILNSTKIDDIHINHGFITHEPDISMSFFERGFTRRPDVVKGRYSWAAEGDTPYYKKNISEREVKSDIYIHNPRLSSSSSSGSSSIDEETETSEEAANAPAQKLPRSSCLKKTKSRSMDTNIVEEADLRKKKSESNLLDSNIFGSLKNIFNFSSSVPLLAERGVPEGQEDVTVISSSHDGASRRSSGEGPKTFGFEIPAAVKKIGNLNLAKTNLKLTKSEGFYPNYPKHANLPSNIILCDSNVYEHKGISYSYEYEKFQKTFEQQSQKPKSSTVYQMLLKELNFFKRKEELPQTEEDDSSSDCKSCEKKYASSSSTVDWPDTETLSDLNENPRHLSSPKRKINKTNHYSVQSFKSDDLKNESKFLKPTTSKTSLINRFLRNVTLRKMIDLKLQLKQKKKYMDLYVKGVKAHSDINDDLNKQIEDEVMNGTFGRKSFEETFDRCLLYRFRSEIFRNRHETLLRVFPVHSAYTTSGECKPLMVLLTNTTFYISGFKSHSFYCNHFVLPYTELNTILIGPNAQTIHVSNYDNDMQCIITTGSSSLTDELIGQLEMAIRKDVTKPKLPAVKHLSMRDMVNLRKIICKQTTVDKEEEYFHYSIVNIQECNGDACDTPLGPSKEGPLMFKTSDMDSRWETAYFILKAGILYMLSSPSHRLPMRVLPLINGGCQGARRVHNCPRPHTFQLIVGETILHLAAPDEYVASEWLQVLVHAASKTYNHREKVIAQSCTLIMTSNHILTVREAFPCTINTSWNLRDAHQPIKGAQALSCAAISDLTAFKLPSAEESWCILEFACREVHESSGDWILYFQTNAELEKFIATLEMLWIYHNERGDSFPLSTIPETDLLSMQCVETYSALQNIWHSLSIRSF